MTTNKLARSNHRFLGAAILIGGTSFAQAPQAGSPGSLLREAQPVVGTVKHAGTYHMATGTWTRPGQGNGAATTARGIADNIYSNTAGASFYLPTIGPTGSAAGSALIDSGGLPGPTNPGPFAVTPDREFYAITEVTIAYCDLDPTPASAGWAIYFMDSHTPCSPLQPQYPRLVTGLPSNGCWTVNIAFDPLFPKCMQADGGFTNPGFDGTVAADSFGIGMAYIGTGVAAAGPILAGDPANTDPGWTAGALPANGTGTYYGGLAPCPGAGSTGYLQLDQLYLSGFGCMPGGYTPATSPCVGPVSPWSGLSMVLSGPGRCDPVGPISRPGCAGAINATGVPGEINVFGNYLARENNARLVASSVPPGQFGMFITSLSAIPPATVNSGNGYICLNPGSMGGLGRFQAPSQIQAINNAGEATLDTQAGAWSLFSIPTATGTYSAFLGISSHFQFWHREPVGAGYNFTGSCEVIWQ